MKAVDANLLELLKKSTQFVVPIYQRVYSWDMTECEQLWSDVVRAGKADNLGAHFTGSIVYVEKDQGTRTSVEPDLIIDGQQRVTTVTLLLAALAGAAGVHGSAAGWGLPVRRLVASSRITEGPC